MNNNFFQLFFENNELNNNEGLFYTFTKKPFIDKFYFDQEFFLLVKIKNKYFNTRRPLYFKNKLNQFEYFHKSVSDFFNLNDENYFYQSASEYLEILRGYNIEDLLSMNIFDKTFPSYILNKKPFKNIKVDYSPDTWESEGFLTSIAQFSIASYDIFKNDVSFFITSLQVKQHFYPSIIKFTKMIYNKEKMILQ